MNKRDFLKDCCLGLGGVACGLLSSDITGGFQPLLAGQGPSGVKPGKWSKEALFTAETAAGVLCLKCPNACVLDSNQMGRCRNRVNYEGKMYSIAYGNPCAVHIDPIEKKPLFHFLPSTRAFSIAAAGCNIACLNCQNWQISQVSPNETENADLMPPAVVEECLRSHCESIAYTYSEPITFYEYAYDTATLAKARGVRNVWKSNGYILEEPLRKLCKVIDAANIDLKSFDDGTYRRLNGGTLAPVLRTLQVFKEEGVWLEITNLLIPGWSDDLEMIKRMCEWLCASSLQDCPLHFSRFMPLYKLAHLPATPVATLEKARDLALKTGIRYAYIGNVPGHLAENTFCHHCHRQVVERKGFVIVQNEIVKGACKHCGGKIPGVWS